jgi:hypothetical protein
VKKLKYKLPSTRYFSMFYPEPIVLSPGLAKEVDVVFRPVEYEPYDDTIYIKMLDGISGNGFHIPVRATIDNLSLKAPEGLDLGYCATHQITQLTFHLVNNGEIDAPYEWDVPEPFSLVPSSGVVPVGKFHEITLSIRPTDASVFVAQALCHVGRGVHAIIPNPVLVTKLSAIGKFAYIAVSDQVVSFDEVVSGMIPEAKEIVLANNSVVPAEFQLIRLDSDRDEVFDIHPKSGVIPPRGELPVSIQYRALAMGCYTHDRYAFRTPGNCNTVFTLKGTSMPPRVTLFKEVVPAKASAQTSETSLTLGSSLLSEEGAPHFSLNFRDIEVGKVETRLLYLRNDSPRDVPFSVIGDENGIFKMTPKQGIVPALVKSFPVKVVFVPPKPINYYRRFFVLVGDAQPLFYDCLGTGFIRAKGEVKEQRPAPIRHAHVQAYRNRSVQGFGGLNPDELDALHENPDVPAHFFAQIGRVGTKAFSVTQLQRPVTRTGESLRNLVAPAHEFFVQGNDSTAREVTVNRLSLDFGYTPFKTSSRPKEVVIHNHTNGKVVVQWYVPPVAGMDRLVAADGGNGHGGKGRDIITADREEKELAALQAFSVTPMTADINPGQSFSFQISFVPKQSSRNFLSELEAVVYFKNQRTFRLVNDFSLTPPWSLTLSCLGHTFSSGQLLAKAAFFGGCVAHNKLVFPACYLGEATYQTVLIRNTSNLPCTFHIEVGWRARHNFQTDAAEGEITSATATAAGPGGSVFSVKPDVGEIAAESFVLVCVRFSPQILKKYSDVLRLVVNGEEGEKLLLEGAGAVPYVIIPDLYEQQAVFPEEILGINKRSMTSAELIPRDTLGTLYMKPTCLGLSSTRTVTLKNATRLPLKYRVLLPAQAAKEDLLAVTPMVGVLKGNDEVQLSLTFRPHRIKSYNFKLTVQVFPIGGRPKRVLDANQPGPVEPPEVVQECSFILNAAGEMGALLFDPAETVAEVRLVHTKEEKAIWLENASDSDLAYRLLYQELFQPDSVELRQDKFLSDIRPLRPVAGHPAAAAATSHDRTAATSSASTTALEKTTAGHGPSPGAFTDSLFCEQHEGVIPARSRLRCIFTYTPVKSGLFEFTLFAQITALHPQTRQPVLLPNDAAALMKLTGSLQAEDLAAVGMASLNLTDGPAAAQTSRPADLSLLPLRASFTARAAFPKLLFEDIRMDNQDQPAASVTALWDRFSLPLLNYDLSIPLTAEEIALNHSSSPDLGRLRVYNFEFLPQVLNSPAQAATIRLRNHGYLPTTFHFHLPNEKQLELENWCDEEDPSEELNRLICIIEELKLFSVEPKEKTLLPGEVCELRLTYRHSSLKYNGLHNIPILVKIAQGKQFYINLKGQTLAALSKKSSVKFIDAKAAAAASSGMQSPVSRGQSLEEGRPQDFRGRRRIGHGGAAGHEPGGDPAGLPELRHQRLPLPPHPPAPRAAWPVACPDQRPAPAPGHGPRLRAAAAGGAGERVGALGELRGDPRPPRRPGRRPARPLRDQRHRGGAPRDGRAGPGQPRGHHRRRLLGLPGVLLLPAGGSAPLLPADREVRPGPARAHRPDLLSHDGLLRHRGRPGHSGHRDRRRWRQGPGAHVHPLARRRHQGQERPPRPCGHRRLRPAVAGDVRVPDGHAGGRRLRPAREAAGALRVRVHRRHPAAPARPRVPRAAAGPGGRPGGLRPGRAAEHGAAGLRAAQPVGHLGLRVRGGRDKLLALHRRPAGGAAALREDRAARVRPGRADPAAVLPERGGGREPQDHGARGAQGREQEPRRHPAAAARPHQEQPPEQHRRARERSGAHHLHALRADPPGGPGRRPLLSPGPRAAAGGGRGPRRDRPEAHRLGGAGRAHLPGGLGRP